MNHPISNLSPLELLFQEYNQGDVTPVCFRSFTLHAGECISYPTLQSALIVPVYGQAVFSFGNEMFLAKRGLFLHGCPQKKLTISVLGKQDFHYINMYYKNEQLLLFSHPLKSPNRTINLLEQILKTNAEPDISGWVQAEKLIEEYFGEIFADFEPEVIYNENEIMNELLDFIAAHYAEAITLNTLSEKVHEKPARISYLFYKYKKIRPIDYLINYRMKIATKLLRSGSYTVKQAAHQVGYQDACYFSRIYKKRMGFSPIRLIP